MPAAWLDGRQRVATEHDCNGRWGGNGFCCSLCGKQFSVGDKWRFVYMNGASPSPGNFFICDQCDEPDIAGKVREALPLTDSKVEPWALKLAERKANQTIADLRARLAAAEAQNAALREALKPFENFYERMLNADDFSYMQERIKDWLGVSDFKRASVALATPPPRAEALLRVVEAARVLDDLELDGSRPLHAALRAALAALEATNG